MKTHDVVVRVRWAEPSTAVAKCPVCACESSVAFDGRTQAVVDAAKSRAVERVRDHHRRRHAAK